MTEPVEPADNSAAPLTIPPTKEPLPAGKLFENTKVPELNDVELLRTPEVTPLPDESTRLLEEPVETFKVSPESNSTTPGDSSGPLLEFNSSSLRDDIALKVVSRERSQVGSGTLFEVYVTNKSTEILRDLTLKAAFHHALFIPNRDGDELTRAISRLDPGEELKIPLTLFSEQEGYHCVRFSLLNAAREELNWKSTCVTYISETLRSTLKGPETISVDATAIYTLLVENLSDKVIEHVSVNLRYDPVLKFLGSNQSVQEGEQELLVSMPRLQAGEVVPVRLAFRGEKGSENTSLTVSTMADNLPATESGIYLAVQQTKGALDLDVEQSWDVFRNGGESEITLICRNRGLDTLRGSRLIVDLPEHVQLIQSGWGAERSTTTADSLTNGNGRLELSVPDIPPGISARYVLKLRGTEAGDSPVQVVYQNPSSAPGELMRSFPLVVVD